MRLFKSNCWTRCSQMSYVAILELSVMFASFPLPAHAQGKQRPMQYPTVYRTIHIDGLSIFYREAGPKDAPILLLLDHTFPGRSSLDFPIVITLRPPFTQASDKVIPIGKSSEQRLDFPIVI